jgi:hypothetical protein
MAARLNTIVAIAMLALYDEFDTYWQNGGYKKISDIIFAECHIFIVSNLWYSTVQYSTVQYSTVQYSTVQYRTGQDRTGQDRAGQGRTGQDRSIRSITTFLALCC